MARLMSLLAAATAMAVAFLVPASASADVNGCPPGFVLVPAEEGVPSGFADRNGDRFACFKLVGSQDPTHARTIFIDNHVPDNTASGVSDTGSSVLVDTATGDVLSG